MGNTYKGIKDCQLCGAKNMNHESHIIMKCVNLKQVRATTDIDEFCKQHSNHGDDTGHMALRSFLDPKEEIHETLLKRMHSIQYLMKVWEGLVEEKTGSGPLLYCYCKQGVSGRMVQCDGCMDWFHFVCAELNDNFMSLDDWFCKKCQNMPVIVMDCCNTQHDDSREAIRCKGSCNKLFHPDCLGLDSDTMIPSWKCNSCSK